MRKRSKPSLQLSLLSYAIAAAAAGVAPGAYAVDLCAGNAATTISTNASGNTCSLDTAGATLTITATGSLDSQVSVSITDPEVSNAGTISTSAAATSWTSVYGIEAGDLGAGAVLANSGTITVSATSSTNSASANGIRFDTLSGGATVTNSGVITATAEAEEWAGAYALGSWSGGPHDDAHITNAATGVITATATGHGGYNYASAYGIFASGQLTGDSSISNAGTITATTITEGSQSASAWAIFGGHGLSDSSISNSGTLTASATTTGSAWAGAWGIDVNGNLTGTSAITNSGIITVSATGSGGSSATAYGIQVNSLHDSSSLTNSGTITATAVSSGATGSGSAYAYGIHTQSLNGTAALGNTGTITATASADTWASAYGIDSQSLNNGAAITNSGTIAATATSATSSASAWGIHVTALNSGSVTNSGSITATATSTPDDTALYQWGGAYGLGSWSWSTMNGLAISNTASGTITASASGDRASAYGIVAYGEMTNGSSISNAGTITATATGGDASYASAYGIYTYSMTDSSITNSGTISASATGGEEWAGAWGIHASGLNGASSISNSGTINSTIVTDSYGSVYGIDTGTLSGTSTITNSGTISATGTANTWMSAYGIEADDLQGTSSITNSGTITASATSLSSSASANGIRFDAVAVGTSVSNSGSISASAVSEADDYWAGAYALGSWAWQAPNEFTLTNSGDITATATADYASAYGMYLYGWGSYSLNMSNSGTIAATATGGDGTYASAYGMYYYGSNYSNTIANSGTITATATGEGVNQWVGAYGMEVRGSLFQDGTLLTGSEVDNSGTIVASATSLNDSASAYGIKTWDVLEGSSVSNSGSITATAQGTNWAGAYGVYVVTMDGTTSLTNDGTITVSATAGDSGTGSALGISVYDLAAGATLTNSGTITASGSDLVEVAGVRVWQGAGTLANSGDIIGGVRLGGTVSMTNSGSLSLSAGHPSAIGGNYTQAAGGQLTTVVESASRYGQLAVTGTADLSASGTLVVELDPTLDLADGDVLHNVVSAGTLTAPASYDIVDSSLFWSFTNVGDTTSIDLEANQASVESVLAGSGVVLTDSQFDVLNTMVGGGFGPQYAALTGALNAAPDAAAIAALVQQLAPALTGSASRAAMAASAGVGALIDARQAETGAASGDAAGSNGVWLKTFLGEAEQDAAVGGLGGFDADTTGFVLGVDGDVSDSWRVGVAVASAQTDAEDAFSALDIDTLQFTVYGRYAMTDATALDLDVNQTVNSLDSTRRVVFAGSTAVAGYDGRQFVLGAGLTHRAKVGGNVTLLPGVALRYRQVHLDGYTETGAGAYDLTVQSRTDSALLWQAKLGAEVGLGGMGTLLANVGAGYDTLDAASATATLSGTGPTFVSQGAKPESTVLNAGLGYRYVTAKGFEINALYELEDRDTFNAETASLKFRMPF